MTWKSNGTKESSEKTIVIRDRWSPQTAKQDVWKDKQTVFYVIYGKSVMSAQTLEVPLLGVGTVLRLERDECSMVK